MMSDEDAVVRRWLFAALAVLILALLLAPMTVHAAPPAPTGGPGGVGYLDSVSSTFAGATSGWMSTAQGYAFKIFVALGALDLSWWGIKQVLKKNDLGDFIAGATLKVASMGFFYTLLTFAPVWMPLIPQSFMQIGQNIGGAVSASYTPSGVMSMAFSVVSSLYSAYAAAPGGLLHIGSNFFLAIVIAVTSLLALAGFALVALQLLMTLVEMYLVGGAGLVMLGFTGSSLTSTFGEKYIGYMVSVGVKLLTIYAIIGLGQGLINSELSYLCAPPFAASTCSPPNAIDMLSIGTSMLMYGVIGIQVPGLAGSMMSGSPSMTLGNMAGGAAAIMAPAAAGVMAAGAAAVGGIKAMQGLENLAARVGAGAVSGASPAGGIGGTEKLAQLGSMTGKTAGAGIEAAGSAAGKGVSAAGSAAGAAIGGVPGLQPLGAAVGAGAKAAGAGMEAVGKAAGKGVEAAGKAAGDATQAVGKAAGAAGKAGEGLAKAGSVPANGAVDALGGAADQAVGGKGSADPQGSGVGKAMRNAGDKLHDFVKHDINRFEGSSGGGIQIRLGHTE